MAVLLMSVSAFAQIKIDRTRQPKPGPAPVIKFADPVKFVLPNGMIVLVVENHKFPKVSASLSFDRGIVHEGQKAGAMSLMGSMLNEGTTSKSKERFDEEVEKMGTSFGLSAGGGSVSSLTRFIDPSLMLLADALRNPAFNSESFDKLKTQTITGLKSQEKNAKAISGRIVNALSYGKNTAQGEFETIQSIEGLTLDEIKKSYRDNLSPANSILTFVGDITPAKAKALAVKAFGSWKGKKLEIAKDAPIANPLKTEIDLVDVPSAVQSEITVANLISNPLTNPDYHALVLANHILGGGSEGKLFSNLREKHGFTYGAYSSVGSGRYQSLFSSTASVRNDKVDSAVAEIINEINNMRAGKISAEELTTAKAVYNGLFAKRMENPQTAANYAASILINKLPKDFYRTYLQKINAITVADIKRVAEKYFNTSGTRIFVVGKSSVVKPGLEKLGYPLHLFDAYASPVIASAEIVPMASDKNITAQAVIEKYLTAIGGRDALSKINSVSSVLSMNMSGQTLGGSMKRMAPNKMAMELSMQGMTVMKQAFNGKSGYQEQMGNKKAMGEDDLAEFNDSRGIFDQLYYTESGFKLSQPALDKVNGEDAYKIAVTKPSGKVSYEYYSVKTGLLLREESKLKVAGQEIEKSTDLSNYITVGNIKMPSEMSQSVAGQSFTITISDYKLNEGVSEKDFE